MIKRKQKNGMTLVEIIFAFAILSTILTLSYASTINSWRSAVSANQRTQAQYLVQQSVESIKAYRASSDFEWSSFLSDLGSTGAPFHMALYHSMDSSETVNDFVCKQPDPPPNPLLPCEFRVKDGATTMSATGSNVTSHSNTVYTLTMIPTEYNVKGDHTAHTGSLPVNTTTVTFVARIEWTDANGVASNSSASTIITEPK